MRRLYTKQHRFYCGIDLHARLLAVCIVDHQTNDIVVRTQIPDDPKLLLDILASFRPDVVVECLFAWYWVADLCRRENIPFVLGHALYMKAIHGGKAKNDDIDAEKIARLLRGGNIAYVYPQGQCYVEWAERFIRFHGLRHPQEMGAAEVTAFLTNLAVRERVAASLGPRADHGASWQGGEGPRGDVAAQAATGPGASSGVAASAARA